MPTESSERLIYIDDLTGLYNRRYLYSHLPKEILAAQSQNYNLWLFMLDVDNFKQINDTYGHLCGDEIIREVSRIIRENTKSDDKKIRYAGDEFTIILPKLEIKYVLNVAERLLAKLRTQTFKDKRTGKEINLTMSLGIAGFPQDATDPVELINLADKSLYTSKQKGKNCFSTASEISTELFWKKDIMDRFPSSVFFERDEELSRLKDGLNKAFQSKGGFYLIAGDLGMGKSRLLSEFENFVAGSGRAYCLASHCEEKYMAQPFHAIGDILYKYFSGEEKLPEAVFAEISEEETAQLYEFLPILKDMPQAPELKGAVLADKKILPQTLVKLLENISRMSPLCLFFDDLHYVDAQTLTVVMHLAQEGKGLPILISAAFSTREVSTPELGASPLATAMKTEALQKSAGILKLPGLSLDATKGMVANIFYGITLLPEANEMIYRITRGNPLFIEELLKFLVEKEYIVYEKGKWAQKEIKEEKLPSTIAEAIKSRIADLSPETKEMIAKAASIGDHFQVDLLQQIDSEDKGYVLDLIEAARKVGLIYDKGTADKDEFSFISAEVRKIIFDSVDKTQIKHFHSRLGEIKEKLYEGNLNSVAGELYYNFMKAQDFTRAEQYAKIVNEGRAAFYDRGMKYAESLLEKAEEDKLTLPLSKKSLGIIPELIRQVYIANVNFILYPSGHKMREQAVEEVYNRLAFIFSDTDILKISLVSGILLANNQKLSKESRGLFFEGFSSLLGNLGIESLSIKRGIGQKELSNFFEILNSLQKNDEGMNLSSLEASGINHIKVGELGEGLNGGRAGQKDSLEEIMLMDYLLGRLPVGPAKEGLAQGGGAITSAEVSETLEKLGEQASKSSGRDKELVKAELMSKSIQKIGSQFIGSDQEGWARYKQALLETVLSMEPSLRANIFSSDAGIGPEGKETQDIIRELAGDIPDNAIIDVFSRQYFRKDNNLARMKLLAQRFLSDPRKRDKLIPQLQEKFFQLGVSPEECEWIFGADPWSGLSLEEKADKIVTMPIKNLFRMLAVLPIAPVISDLVFRGKDAAAEAIMERLFQFLEEGYPDSRALASHLQDVLGILAKRSTEKLFPKFLQRLIKDCQAREELFLFVISPNLEKITEILLSENNLFLINEIIRFFVKSGKAMGEAAQTLEPVILRLVAEFTRRIDANLEWQELAELLVLFKDKATIPLIEAALFEKGVEAGKYFEAYVRRITIGKVITRLPKENIYWYLKKKFSSPNVYVARNLIELIGAMEDEEALKSLEIPLESRELILRKKAVFVLGKIHNNTSTMLLSQALRDEDAGLRRSALDLLKSRSDDKSREALAACKKDAKAPEDVRRLI